MSQTILVTRLVRKFLVNNNDRGNGHMPSFRLSAAGLGLEITSYYSNGNGNDLEDKADDFAFL